MSLVHLRKIANFIQIVDASLLVTRLHGCRSIPKFSTCVTLHQDKEPKWKCIKQIEKTVNPYGSFELCNARIDLVVKPASPEDFPDMDTAICSWHSTVNYTSQEREKLELIIDDGKLTFDPVNEARGEKYCRVEIPIKYDIDIREGGESSVQVQSMESSLIRIVTNSGEIKAKGIKGDLIQLKSKSGSISCEKATQGRVVIRTESGNIHGGRFVGPSLKFETVSGDISTESVYSDVSHISSWSGNVYLKNLHRECHVDVNGGNLTISGMDGSLDARLGPGRHEIQISRLKDRSEVRVTGSGHVTLKIPDPCPFGLRIRAQSITLPTSLPPARKLDQHEEFTFGTDSQCIDVDAPNGTVTVEHEDWFASLGLAHSK